MEKEKIRDCQCGGKGVLHKMGKKYSFVRCDNCHRRGPRNTFEPMAIMRWNESMFVEPCVNCGHKDIKVISTSIYLNVPLSSSKTPVQAYYARCTNATCRLIGPVAPTRLDAMAFWNRWYAFIGEKYLGRKSEYHYKGSTVNHVAKGVVSKCKEERK
jgi:hypothetical protein